MHTDQCTRIDLLNVKYFNSLQKRGQGSKEEFFNLKGSAFNLVCVTVCIEVTVWNIGDALTTQYL